jgi:cell wall-associated NlpC family hydrolase
VIARAAVLAEARKHAKDGVRWEHMGRTVHGLDCVGLIVIVCATLGISDYDLDTYPREPKSSEFLDHFTKGGGTRIPINAALPGDLMLFREGRYPCHVAFLSERDGLATIIHAHATRRMVLEEVLIREWLVKRVAAVRLPGVG